MRKGFALDDERLKNLDGDRYLNVPYGEKDEAKSLGAKWDAKVKKGNWFLLK